MKLCVAIGHTKEHPGATYEKENEYSYNSKLALLILEKLRVRGNSGLMITKDDLSQSQIDALVNRSECHLYVELHCNAFASKDKPHLSRTARGTETLYIGENSSNSMFAGIIQNELVIFLDRVDKENRGIKELSPSSRGYENLAGIDCPSCLLEPFFIDNREDFTLGIAYMDNIATAVSIASQAFYDIIYRKV